MNKTAVRDLIKRAEDLQTDIETMRDDLQAEWDDRTERWQESDKGTRTLRIRSTTSTPLQTPCRT